ncbi:hypothetical protein M9Y10_038604 [Tritrichomonas musculus]|uniref:Uncharacterized protein n=1 Tax=Tritrichomonas musculus TaxID=1915356 RepID=A0ABR2KC23_9EUKA
MTTDDDIATLKKALSVKQAENDEVYRQIQAESNNYQKLFEIRQRIDDIKSLNEDDQNSYQKEQKKLIKQIDKIKKKINGFEKTEVKKVMSINTVKLTALEVSLNTSVDKMIKTDNKLAELKENSKDKIFQIQEMDKNIENLEKFVSKYETISNSITNTHLNINFLLVDLESHVTTLQYHITNTRQRTSDLKVTLDELITQKAIQQQQIEDFEQDSETPLTTVMPNLYSLKMTEINQLISECQEFDFQNNKAINKLNEIRSQIKQEEEAFKEQKKGLLDTIQKLNDDSNSILTQIENSKTQHKTQIIKTKQLQEQLKLKIKDMQNAILKTRSKDPSISTISEKLEKEWSNHQATLDVYQKWQNILEKDRVILEKKIKVIAELKELCPLNSKVKTEVGVQEFLFLFDVAYTQNRDMGKDLQLLMKEKEELEKENKELKKQISK